MLLYILSQPDFLSCTAECEDQDCTTASQEKQEEEKEEENNEEEGKDEENEEVQNTDADSSKPYTCKWCKKTFAYKCRMLTHMKRCPLSQKCEQQCPECPIKLHSQRALRQHQAVAHRNSPRVKKKVSCDLCGRTFAHPSGENSRSHHDSKTSYSLVRTWVVPVLQSGVLQSKLKRRVCCKI